LSRFGTTQAADARDDDARSDDLASIRRECPAALGFVEPCLDDLDTETQVLPQLPLLDEVHQIALDFARSRRSPRR